MSAIIETLNLPNYSQNNILEELELNADAAAGQAIILVINSAGVVDNDYLVLNPGNETSEIKKINTSGVSGQNITFNSNLAILHRNHERVIKLYGNQIRVWRAPNVDGTIPADSAFAVIGAVNIKPDQPFTTYTDNVGGPDFWYKFTYYNTVTTLETDITLSEATRGGGWGHYVSIEDIRAEAGLNDSRKLDDTQIAARRSEAESEIKGKLAAAGYVMPLQTAAGVYYTPALIENIARILSAGLILMQNFGTTRPNSSKDGKAKVDLARAMLAEIQLNDVVLLDTNDQMLLKPALLDGWPDDSTATAGSDGVTPEPPRATMSKVF